MRGFGVVSKLFTRCWMKADRKLEAPDLMVRNTFESRGGEEMGLRVSGCEKAARSVPEAFTIGSQQ